MKREFAKPIAEVLGVVAVVAFFLVAWLLDWQIKNWPPWTIFALAIGCAALVIFAAIRVTKRVR